MNVTFSFCHHSIWLIEMKKKLSAWDFDFVFAFVSCEQTFKGFFTLSESEC